MTLEIRDRDGVCELHLNAPPGNIFTRALCESLTEAVATRAADPHLRAFLFTASGKNFSFGASVPEHAPGEVEQFLPAFHALFTTLAESRVPTVAAVSGLCLGGAFELAAFCNFLVADESAVFATPEIQLGVFPPLACLVLPWKVGGALAEDLILTGRRLTAAEAKGHGLVTHLCPAEELEPAVEKFLEERIRPLSGAAMRIANRALRRTLLADLPLLERVYLDELMATRDAVEGIAAFTEKRKPEWADA